ncbi:MAG TPA: MBL fold metallo-hydrolase [Candidatus Pacearchaeota archaeon]|nr:MBL fold metallo-hydrolase [Candidatus Pacearchaeota archaeon]
MKIEDVEIKWLGHAAFKIKANDKVIYIDPYQLTAVDEKADVVLITHSHYDHCSQQDIEKVVKDNTVVVCTPDSQSKIARIEKKITIELVEPGTELSFDGLKIKAVEAYNINKQFHPKSQAWVGYVIQTNSVAIYHAGDTDKIKEMEKLTGYGTKQFIALLPVGGTYTMDAEEAAEAAALIKPTLAIPMHYGTIVGSVEDAKKFCELCKEKGINTKILEKG